MSDKQIHIVFQVLNWLHSDFSLPFKLLPNECRLLINFASHKGVRGIYPSVPTLMKELKLSRSQILRVIKSLEKKNLIEINRKIGVSNSYYLTIPFEKLSTTRVTHDTGSMYEPVSPMTPVPVSPVRHTRVTHDTLITKKNKKKNREMLSEDFFPDQKTKAVVFEELAYNKDEANVILQDFFNEYLDEEAFLCTQEEWQHRCRKWFKREKRQPGFLEEKKSPVIEDEPPKPRSHWNEEVRAVGNIYQLIGTKGIGK